MNSAFKQGMLSHGWAILAGIVVAATGYPYFGDAAIGFGFAVTLIGFILAWIELRLTELVELMETQ